ncbi:hypothetical protein RHGRI_014679 [Rhododendron griersonianum]|uniref:PDZ domain-containing protein n=1 Tax=Rhododendron griersonianum TaxID=479676 RepID=A0AAV6KAB6_9ERIC|nr:hypothetical protein RHGRI_014679 [Rhododendron griersonianum]
MTPTKRRLEGPFKRRLEERFWFGPSQRRRYDFDVTDPNIRRAVLKVSPAVISVVSFAGGDIFLVASGTIIKCEDVNGTYSSSILTCASLLRPSTDSNTMGDNIEVFLVDGKSFNGCMSAHDHHYNIAIIKITSDVALPTVSLATVDDSISTDLSESPSLRCPSSSVSLCNGDSVVALGRLGSDATELMAALGKFSHERCKFDYRELFRANCEIRKAGVGGPLINCHGEVIGLNFYDSYCTPFLPINIVLKCLKRFERNREPRRPWLGMDLTYLCVLSIGKLEKIMSKFNISSSVLVQEVVKGSPAEQAGILKDDIIVQFGDNSVRSVLEFYNAMWKKVGKSAELVVIRESSSTHLKLKVFVEETSPDKANR